MRSRSQFHESDDPFAGSFLFGTNSPPHSSKSMSSPSLTGNMATPTSRQRQNTEIKSPPSAFVHGSTQALRTRRPPLSSVLDDAHLLSPGGLGYYRSNNQHQQLFSGNPTPRKAHFESSAAMSVEDPFLRTATKAASSGGGLRPVDSTFIYDNSGPNPFASPTLQSNTLRNRNVRVSSSYAPHSRDGLDDSVYGNNMSMQEATPTPTDPTHGRSPILTLGQFPPAYDKVDAAWNCWVMVYGYQMVQGVDTDEAVLARFREFGQIERSSPSTGNWIFIKYATPAQAERAASQSGTFLDSRSLVAVTRLTLRVAQYMNLSLHRDGSLTVGEVDVTVPYSCGAHTATTTTDSDQASLLQRGPRQRLETSGKYQVSRSVSSSSGVSCLGGDGAAADADLYLRPRRVKSVCEKIVEYFFAY